MRRAWEHLNPGTGQGSLFANTVVITDTALTPASCPHLRARSHHGATTYRSLFIQKAETSSYRWTTHTRKTTIVRANIISNAAEANGYDARVMGKGGVRNMTPLRYRNYNRAGNFITSSAMYRYVGIQVIEEI